MTNYAINNADLMAQDAIRKRALLAQQNGYVQKTNSADEESIMTQNKSAKSDDIVGKDDGKIGFWKGLKSFGKGILNFGKGLIGFDKNGNWSAGRLLKNVAIGAGVAAVCVLTAGTAVPAIIAGAGVATAAAGLAKSQYQFWTAKTDAQAIAAMENTGSNAAGLGLSLVGAKATMKQVPGVDAAKYDGALGTLKAGWDSTTIGFIKGWSGIKTGYKAYKTGGYQTLRTVAKENWNGFKDTVKTNYQNATKVPTIEEQQTNRVKQYDDKIADLKERAAATEDHGVKYALNKQAKRLEEQKANIEQAYQEINSETSFANAQSKMNKLQEQIETMKHQVESYTDKRVKFLKEHEIAKLEQQIDVYKAVLNQKTTQARNIRAEIDRINKLPAESKTPEVLAKRAELYKQQNELNFRLPERSQYETLTKQANESSQNVFKVQEAYDKAKQEYATAEKAYSKYEKGDTSSEAMLAELNRNKTKNTMNDLHTALIKAQIENSTNQALQSAASGADYAGAFLPKAGQFFQTFNKQYGKTDVPYISGKKVPFTQFTIPSINNAQAVVATNEWVNPSVGGPSLDEMLMQELQNEQVAQYQQATQTQQTAAVPTEADYAKAYAQAFNEYQALVQAQQAQQAQAGARQTTHQGPTAADYQALDYLMKANGIVA